MTAQTTWCQLDDNLLNQLFNQMEHGEQIAVLGPRQGAKALIIERLMAHAEKLALPSRPQIVRLIWDQFEVCDPEQFIKRLADTLEVAPPTFSDGQHLAPAILKMLQDAVACGRPIWIFLQDVVGFPKRIARQILQALEECQDDEALKGRVAALVTGSAEFLPLLYGSEVLYPRASKIVLTGMAYEFAWDYFCERRQYVLGVRKPVPSPQEERNVFRAEEIHGDAFTYLYEQTGGHAHLIQELLVGVVRHPFNSKEPWLQRPWDLESTKRYIELCMEIYLPYNYILRTTLREVESNAEHAALLLRVLEGDTSSARSCSPRNPMRWRLMDF